MKALVIGKFRKVLSSFGGQAELLLFDGISSVRKAKTDNTTVFYVDRSSVSKDVFGELVKTLAARNLVWGVLDPKGQIEDPAALFFAGASDYVSAAVLGNGIGEARIRQALNFANDTPTGAHDFPEFPGWDKLVPRQEYPFIFLIVSLNLSEEFKKSLGEKRTENLKRLFINYLMHAIQDSGKIWISDGSYALVLFPPGLSVLALRTAMQMIINAIPLAHEYFSIPQVLNTVFSLHIGVTPWEKAGKTGDIISEDINFIHHVIKKIAKPNCVLASSQFVELLPDGLKTLFVQDKTFEGHEMYRSMRYLTVSKKDRG